MLNSNINNVLISVHAKYIQSLCDRKGIIECSYGAIILLCKK